MKIITWNCNMAFRKKAELMLLHKPVEIGEYETWTQYSDHVPVIVTFTP